MFKASVFQDPVFADEGFGSFEGGEIMSGPGVLWPRVSDADILENLLTEAGGLLSLSHQQKPLPAEQPSSQPAGTVKKLWRRLDEPSPQKTSTKKNGAQEAREEHLKRMKNPGKAQGPQKKPVQVAKPKSKPVLTEQPEQKAKPQITQKKSEPLNKPALKSKQQPKHKRKRPIETSSTPVAAASFPVTNRSKPVITAPKPEHQQPAALSSAVQPAGNLLTSADKTGHLDKLLQKNTETTDKAVKALVEKAEKAGRRHSGEVVDTDTRGQILLADNYKPVRAEVTINRETDGLDPNYSSTRRVETVMANGQRLLTGKDDNIGANARDSDFIIENAGMTLPDGHYYFTRSGLTVQEDGSADSYSFANTLRYQTRDLSIPEALRKEINTGSYLNHANAKKNKPEKQWTNTSQSAGCTTQRGGQAAQDDFIKQLSGVAPENVQINIQSKRIVTYNEKYKTIIGG
ncbi:MAG: hypothetical protein CSA76_06215 [Spirochaetales bacterium]|nr:MAG: hypothetical protein CSA76_06215 [Spirochaetales bacterium]